MQPITKHSVTELKNTEYSIESKIKPDFRVLFDFPKKHSFLYCVSYRDTALDEWILARGYWNDEGIWIKEGIFPM